MLVQYYWLMSPLFIVSASTYSIHNTSISTIEKTTIPTNSTHHISATSTKSSTVTPTSIPSTFYLVASETYQNKLDGSFFKIIPDPAPVNPLSGDKALQFANKNSTGAANFTLNDDGTLQCNSDSGPLYASVSNSLPGIQTLEFEDPNELDRWGLVAVTCQIAGGFLICQWDSLVVFYYDLPDVVDGMQNDGRLTIGAVGDEHLLLDRWCLLELMSKGEKHP